MQLAGVSNSFNPQDLKTAEKTELASAGNVENMMKVKKNGKCTLIKRRRRWNTSEQCHCKLLDLQTNV